MYHGDETTAQNALNAAKQHHIPNNQLDTFIQGYMAAHTQAYRDGWDAGYTTAIIEEGNYYADGETA